MQILIAVELGVLIVLTFYIGLGAERAIEALQKMLHEQLYEIKSELKEIQSFLWEQQLKPRKPGPPR